MALKDLFNTGLQIGDWWQTGQSIDNAEDYIKEGFDQGRTDVKNYADPYADFGKWGMEGYKGLGEFGFDYNNYLGSDNYNWMKEQGMDGVNRTAAASHALGSGNTLDSLVRNNQNYAQSQYGQEHARQLSEFGANRDYYGVPIQAGLDASKFAGQYLSDMAIGEGGAMSGLEAARSGNLSNLLGSAGGGEGAKGDSLGSTIADALSWVGDTLGITGSDAVEYVSKALSISPAEVSGAIGAAGSATTMFGGGAAAGMGTGAGAMAGGVNGAAAMGSLPEGFGGTFAAGLGEGTTATGATAATSGFGTWAASVAGGFAVLAGIKFLNESIGADPTIGKTLVEISKSKDPLGAIGKLGHKDMIGLFARDEMIGRVGSQYVGGEGWVEGSHSYIKPNVQGNASKGMLYGMIFDKMPQESMKALRFRSDIGVISQDMLSALVTGRSERNKYTNDMIGDPTAGMSKLFPQLAGDFEQLRMLSTQVRSNSSYNQDYAGDFNGMTRIEREVPVAERDALALEIQEKMNTTLDRWSTKALVSKLQEEAGVV